MFTLEYLYFNLLKYHWIEDVPLYVQILQEHEQIVI